MKRKVIYVSQVHLSDKLSQDYICDYLITKGITVEFWDIVSLVREEYNVPNAKFTDYVRTFRLHSEVEAMLRLPENRDAIYIMLVSYFGRAVRIFRLMSKYDCTMLKIEWCSMPSRRVQKWRKLLSIFSNSSQIAEKVFFKAKAIAYRKLQLVKPFDIVFAAGQALMSKNLYARKVIPINVPDYDQDREEKLEADRLVEGRYAVFLDTFLPYHSDLKVIGWRAVKPVCYYASLNRFFELLEAKYEIKVVIAAHPRARYSVEPFNGREVYYNRTHELVRGADFVIDHHSVSISYAVLNHKPIVFIYTDEMVSLYSNTIVSYIHDFAEYLDAAIYNIDKITQSDQIIIKDVSHGCYEEYKYNFLTTHESEHVTTREIFWREINRLFNRGAVSESLLYCK